MGKPKSKMASTRAALAEALGVHRSQISRWLAHDCWNLNTTPPWNIAAVRAWRDEFLDEPRNQSAAGGSDPTTKDLRKRLLAAKTKEAEAKAAKVRGERIPRESIDRIIQRWTDGANEWFADQVEKGGVARALAVNFTETMNGITEDVYSEVGLS